MSSWICIFWVTLRYLRKENLGENFGSCDIWGQGNSLFYTIAICAVLNARSISLEIVSPKMLPHCSKGSLVLGGRVVVPLLMVNHAH